LGGRIHTYQFDVVQPPPADVLATFRQVKDAKRHQTRQYYRQWDDAEYDLLEQQGKVESMVAPAGNGWPKGVLDVYGARHYIFKHTDTAGSDQQQDR
jgi:hypothetical protein